MLLRPGLAWAAIALLNIIFRRGETKECHVFADLARFYWILLPLALKLAEDGHGDELAHGVRYRWARHDPLDHDRYSVAYGLE